MLIVCTSPWRFAEWLPTLHHVYFQQNESQGQGSKTRYFDSNCIVCDMWQEICQENFSVRASIGKDKAHKSACLQWYWLIFHVFFKQTKSESHFQSNRGWAVINLKSEIHIIFISRKEAELALPIGLKPAFRMEMARVGFVTERSTLGSGVYELPDRESWWWGRTISVGGNDGGGGICIAILVVRKLLLALIGRVEIWAYSSRLEGLTSGSGIECELESPLRCCRCRDLPFRGSSESLVRDGWATTWGLWKSVD